MKLFYIGSAFLISVWAQADQISPYNAGSEWAKQRWLPYSYCEINDRLLSNYHDVGTADALVFKADSADSALIARVGDSEVVGSEEFIGSEINSVLYTHFAQTVHYDHAFINCISDKHKIFYSIPVKIKMETYSRHYISARFELELTFAKPLHVFETYHSINGKEESAILVTKMNGEEGIRLKILQHKIQYRAMKAKISLRTSLNLKERANPFMITSNKIPDFENFIFVHDSTEIHH